MARQRRNMSDVWACHSQLKFGGAIKRCESSQKPSSLFEPVLTPSTLHSCRAYFGGGNTPTDNTTHRLVGLVWSRRSLIWTHRRKIKRGWLVRSVLCKLVDRQRQMGVIATIEKERAVKMLASASTCNFAWSTIGDEDKEKSVQLRSDRVCSIQYG